MKIIGVDPGMHCGIATFDGGELGGLLTMPPHMMMRWLDDTQESSAIGAIIFEDSRLQSFLWNARAKGNTGIALRTARSVGYVDAVCAVLEEWCAEAGVQSFGVSPKGKGAKLDATAFARATGWTWRCNQHERDAAMVVWPYRTMKDLRRAAR